MATETVRYRMNPAEDKIVFGGDLAEGMWVLNESITSRQPYGDSEDEKIRSQRFRRVTRLQSVPGGLIPGAPPGIIFVAEWIDGYQEVHRYAVTHAWIVKKDPITAGDENYYPGETPDGAA